MTAPSELESRVTQMMKDPAKAGLMEHILSLGPDADEETMANLLQELPIGDQATALHALAQAAHQVSGNGDPSTG